MKSDRKLSLRRETLVALSTDELRAVAAGSPKRPTDDCPDNTYYCITGPAMCDLSRHIC